MLPNPRLGRKHTRCNLPLRPTHYEYDMSAARRDFGYAPTLSIAEVVDEALEAEAGRGSLIPTSLAARL
jgi:hypothetical protein